MLALSTQELQSLLASPEAWIALLTLTALEIVLGIDNIVFITILASRLPKEKQLGARRLGLAAALITRIALLLGLGFVMRLQTALFSVGGHEVSLKDIILLVGGLFLIAKATVEIYNKVELAHEEGHGESAGPGVSLTSIVLQIMVMDIIFSLDSVITAVGMARDVPVMVAAVMVAVGVMMVFAGPIGDFVDRNPSIKILALSFLVMIGVLLVAEGWHAEMSKGYVYFGMGFALGIEILNMRYRKRHTRLEVRGEK